MIKVTENNIAELYNKDYDMYRNWAILNESIFHFCNNARLKQFEFIFNEDGERLWKHFKLDCDSNYQKFKTYLTQDQLNTFVISVFNNKDELFYI